MRFKEFLTESAGEFLTDVNEIEAWLTEMKIKKYTIGDTGVVDVDGDVNLRYEKLACIPIQFGKVTGFFDCSRNELTSLTGAPTHVGGSFWCDSNKLKSLIGAPANIIGNFTCNKNDLATLGGCPSNVSRNFYCHDNNLTSLEGCPQYIGGEVRCFNNELTSHTLGLILTGCTSLVADDNEAGWAKIINKYLGRPA